MICCVFGRRGTGKTTYLKEIVHKSLLPVIVIDTMQEFEKDTVLLKTVDDINFNFFKVRFIPQTQLDFEILCRCVFNQRFRYGINVVIDEVDYWSSYSYLPREFENTLKFSRHYKINLFLSVRNPVEIHRRITGLADKFIIFRVTEPRYLNYFKQFDQSLPEAVRSLPKYKYIEYKV